MFPRPSPFADELGFAGGAVDDGGGEDVAGAAIDNNIYHVFEKIVHYFGVGEVFNMAIHGQGGAHDGVAKLFYKQLAYPVIWHADADGVLLCL